MGIWIRSQDKKRLINANEIKIDDFHNLYKNAIWGNDVLLGEYSTEEKALKVLDVIQEHIEHNGRTQDYRTFQMPQDDEVE